MKPDKIEWLVAKSMDMITKNTEAYAKRALMEANVMSTKSFQFSKCFVAVLSVTGCVCTVGLAAGHFEWEGARPESQGFSTKKLTSLKDSLAARCTKALLIVRNDRIFCEWYTKGHGPDKKHYTASLAKALVGGMSLLIALNDGLNLVANWGGGSYTARAVARVGRLMLRRGNWQGRQLIDERWVERVLQYARTPLPPRPPGNPQPACGLAWYTNFDGVWPKIPRDAFTGAGAGNQVLLVVPSLDLIVVRNGSNLYDSSKGEGFWGGLEKHLFNPLMDTLVASGPDRTTQYVTPGQSR